MTEKSTLSQPRPDLDPTLKTVLSQIDHEIKANHIVLYMKGSPSMPKCGFSARAAAILSSYEVPLTHVDVLKSPEKRQAIKEYSQWPTLPQIYVGGEFLGGSDILVEMHASGELRELLGAAS